jgi:UDP-N-acetylglucosamine--N-acetylmuramyl-(pentapeptide) pyrophosphoryl-undecaprenol N-acetylglucosamine transferase
MPDTKTESDLYKKLGVPEGTKKILLSFGGSLGAQRVNEEILALMRDYTAHHPEIFHIHATGKIEYEDAMAMAKEYRIDSKPNIRLLEYIYDMPLWEKAADAVVCRAGAMTLAELALLGKACVLIPSPNVTDNHQEKNARAIAQRGGAVVMLEKDCTAQALLETIQQILAEPKHYEEMCSAMRTSCVLDSAERICDIMQQLIK